MIGKFAKYAGIATMTIMDLIAKAADGVFTLPEMVDTIEKTARQAVPGVADSDFERFQAITSAAEYHGADFKDGDVALYDGEGVLLGTGTTQQAIAAGGGAAIPPGPSSR